MPDNYLDELVDHWFSQEDLSSETLTRIALIKSEGKHLADLIVKLVPASREQYKALDQVRNAVMWANVGLAMADGHRADGDDGNGNRKDS